MKKHLADAVMWTYHGREFPAPTFELGTAPAGCMYSTVLDLAKFQSCLFAGGKVGDKQLLQARNHRRDAPAAVRHDRRPSAASASASWSATSKGSKRIGHGGAIYGFATEFAALPNEKLGVIVVSSRDVSNAVTGRIADDALRLMLAAKAGKPLPKIETSEPLSADEARRSPAATGPASTGST